MRFIIALFYFVLCLINLIHTFFFQKTLINGIESLLLMGITGIGIYLSCIVMANNLPKKN